MTVRTVLLAILLVSALSAPHSLIAGPTGRGGGRHDGPMNPAHRIVGLWSTEGALGPCDTGVPTQQVRNNLLFHAGGTVTENIPPTSARNQGLGVWSYNPATGWYTLHLRFDRYASGVYSGFTIVERHLRLNPGGMDTTGPVQATLYAPDGSAVQLCGEATSERLL